MNWIDKYEYSSEHCKNILHTALSWDTVLEILTTV